MNSAQIIETSGNWAILYSEERYFLLDISDMENPKAVRTPGGNPLNTEYFPLAKMMLDDLELKGPDYWGATSILPWQYTIIDNFSQFSHEKLVDLLEECFFHLDDWTYELGEQDDEKKDTFGEKDERLAEIRNWLSQCTHMQLTAACCVANPYRTLNIPYILAMLMETYPGNDIGQEKALSKEIKGFAKYLSDNNDDYATYEEFLEVFNNFQLYYGIHMEENGNIINKKIPSFALPEPEIEVTPELLIGRNFYHYTGGKRDLKQDFVLKTDLDYLVESDEKDLNDSEMISILPNDCWVKRFRNDDDSAESYYLLVLKVTNNRVVDYYTALDEVTRMGAGSFVIAGIDMPASHRYIPCFSEIEPCEKEIANLKLGKYLSSGFSFIGKKIDLTKNIADSDNGECLNVCRPSAHRLATLVLTVHYDEDSVITGLDFEAIQSSGDWALDLSMRPQEMVPLREEIVEMLITLMDTYLTEW